ncbi:MAG: bifunctional folylpolyglutamate synthase/dihydrofolate synthase [Alphaproteobacteria bacterium]|nr:MAG: bifunctional folylpolyglutamate synthase/dihydrofolate synthase [Alphaproteobacteria bacterium]
MARINEMLAALMALHPKLIDLSLGRIEQLLERLGRPQDRLAPVIHIAGTNGKGSTAAFLRAILEAQGHGVHVYTSPHLVRFNERIRLAASGRGKLVDDATLIAAIAHVQQVNGGDPITYFEVTSAVAFHLFAENQADYTILEVGLGGRYDATNVIATPLASVITPVSYDHAEFLGTDLADIAAEKAGILKRGVPGIVGPQNEHALAMIGVEADAVGANLMIHGQDWTAFEERGRLVYQDEDGLLDLPMPRLAGQHQIDNAGLAIATLRRAGVRLDHGAIEAGLRQANWPARLQRLRDGPLVALAPKGSEIWLDGGHNPAAGAVLAETLADLEERVPKPLVMIAGMQTTKDPQGFFAPFAGLARHVMAVPVPGTNAGFDPQLLADQAMAADLPARAFADVGSALSSIGKDADTAGKDGNGPRILICGSLYLAGAVLKENGPLPD